MLTADHTATASAMLGGCVHRAVQALLRDGNDRPTPVEILAAVGAVNGHPRFLSSRRPDDDAVLAWVATYFRYFPAPDDALPVAFEQRLANVRLDIAWAQPAGVVVVDELKSRLPDLLVAVDPLTRQLAAQLRACREAFGDRFAGIRLLALATPRSSLLVAPDGSLSPIRKDSTWPRSQ